nr:hypothetical protein [Tanacetum cinerariifolium]
MLPLLRTSPISQLLWVPKICGSTVRNMARWLTFTLHVNFLKSVVDLLLFERKPNTTLKPSNQPSTKQTNTQPKSASSSSHANPNRSYVNALNGKASHNPPDDKVILKSVTLDAADLLVTSNLSNVVLAKNSEMSWYFTAMKHVTHSFKADERIVLIKISGIPLNFWTSKAFKKLLKAWGKSHNVCVKEFAGWVPNIKVMESKSSKNYEADNFVDDDFNDNVNDHDPNEVEEDVDEQPENHANSPIILENHMQDPIKPTVNHNDDSKSFLKPPGFESFKCKPTSSKQQSTSSFAAAKSSRSNKSHSKLYLNHGSMIETFISHIEMCNVLGYDMEGSKNNLKKFIDSIGVKHGH